MKNKKYLIRYALFLMILSSCSSKQSNIALDNKFSVSGSIQDRAKNGVKDIKIYYQAGKFVVSDALGKWKIGPIEGTITIEPLDPGYTFSPTSIVASANMDGIVFNAQPKTNPVAEKHPLAENVFSWFKQMQRTNGLLESTENGNFVSLYDNALAALVFIEKNERTKAEAIFDFFNSRMNSELLSGNGGFYQFRDANGTPTGIRGMGDNAWMLIALNNHAVKYNSTTYISLRQGLSNWLRSLQNSDGSVNAGFDDKGLLNYQVTEGMIDAFNAINGYDSFHSKLLGYFKVSRWDATDRVLVSWPGNYYRYALDNYSWGYCAFQDFPTSTLQKADIFLTTHTATVNSSSVTGYCFDIDKDNVWPEGTGQMIVAYQKAGNFSSADYYLAEIEKLLVKSNLYPTAYGIPYASNFGTHYANAPLWQGADTKPCVSSGAWYLFGVLQFDPMAVNYNKTIPLADKFWIN